MRRTRFAVLAGLFCLASAALSGCKAPGVAATRGNASAFQANHRSATVSPQAKKPSLSPFSLVGRSKVKDAEKPVDAAPESGTMLKLWGGKPHDAAADAPARRWPLPLTQNSTKSPAQVDEF